MDEFKWEKCNDICSVHLIDCSLDHEFGREESYYFGSDCCGANIVDEYGQDVPQSELEEIWEGI